MIQGSGDRGIAVMVPSRCRDFDVFEPIGNRPVMNVIFGILP